MLLFRTVNILQAVSIVMILSYSITAYNVSPVPNIILRKPEVLNDTFYFGFSINLKTNSVLVGAPRAQLNQPNQQIEINKPGAIYKCDLNDASVKNCKPFLFDKSGNAGGFYNKSGQWLGMSMDGSASDNQPFVSCAPRFVTYCKGCDEKEIKARKAIENMSKRSNENKNETCVCKECMELDDINDTAMHGVCYWSTNTSSDQPIDMVQVLNITKQQLIDDMKYIRKKSKTTYRAEKYFVGQQGFSVHVTENNEEILMGAPGMLKFMGLVIRQKIKDPRKKLNLNAFNGSNWYDGKNRSDKGLFGFAISSGYFEVNNRSKLLYVASAPKKECGHDIRCISDIGAVYIFDFVINSAVTQMKKYYKFQSNYTYEYFGYSVLAEDFNNDGLTDIAIGAPQNIFHETNIHYANGAVYIYTNLGEDPLNFRLQATLRTRSNEIDFGFGTTLSKAGDINQDGFNDLIVAAPFEGNGAIYIYFGSSHGLSDKPYQKIEAPYSRNKSWFGYGLSKGVDIDGNHYVDFAIGSPNSDTVYIYKTYPVIQVITTIETKQKTIHLNETSFELIACFSYRSKFPIGFDISFNAIVRLNDNFSRANFRNGDQCNGIECKINGLLLPHSNQSEHNNCKELNATVIFNKNHIYEPIHIEMTSSVVPLNLIPNYDIKSNEAKEFCKACVAVDPNSLTNVTTNITFDTGCVNENCVIDLNIKRALKYDSTQCNGDQSFKLGVSSMRIEYIIENHGEIVYFANLFISIPNNTKFMQLPPSCEQNVAAPNKIDCTLTENAAISKGDCVTFNISIDTSKLIQIETLLIEASVSSNNKNDLERNSTNNIIVDKIPLVDFSEIKVYGYSTDEDSIKIYEETNVTTLMHVFTIENHGPSNTSLNVTIYLPEKYVDPVTGNEKDLIDANGISVRNVLNKQKIKVEWSRVQNDSKILIFNNTVKNADLISSLKLEQIIYFKCNSSTDQRCIQGNFTLEDVNIYNPISIMVNIPIDMKSIASIKSEPKDGFAFVTSIAVKKISNENCSSIDISSNPSTIFTHMEETSIWIHIVSSILLGIAILAAFTYAMYKFGFFTRAKHEELKKLKRESIKVACSDHNGND